MQEPAGSAARGEGHEQHGDRGDHQPDQRDQGQQCRERADQDEVRETDHVEPTYAEGPHQEGDQELSAEESAEGVCQGSGQPSNLLTSRSWNQRRRHALDLRQVHQQIKSEQRPQHDNQCDVYDARCEGGDATEEVEASLAWLEASEEGLGLDVHSEPIGELDQSAFGSLQQRGDTANECPDLVGQDRNEVGKRQAGQGQEDDVTEERPPHARHTSLLQPRDQGVQQIDDDERHDQWREDDLDGAQDVARDRVEQDQDADQ